MSIANDMAFPLLDKSQALNGTEQLGLTKREYFASLAMQGLCANSIPGSQHVPRNLAREALAYADALIAELELESLLESKRILQSLPLTGDIARQVIANDAAIAKAMGDQL